MAKAFFFLFVVAKSAGERRSGTRTSPLKRNLQEFESADSELGQFGSSVTATKKKTKKKKTSRAATVGHSRVFFFFSFVLFTAGAWFQDKNGQAVPSGYHGSSGVGQGNHIPEDCAKFWLGVFIQRPLSAGQRSGKYR